MSRFAVYHWIKTNAIQQSAEAEALKVADERVRADSWPPFIRKLLWITGSLALVVALLFFMAYNWQAMGPMFKFGLLQGSLLLAVFLYWLWSSVLVQRFHLTRATIELGQTIARLVIALLVGGLLALFGQTYQTGADPWQLFALWSLLVSLMVITSGQPVLWAFWSVLINVALVLYVDTRPMWLFLLGGGEQAVWLFLVVNAVLWLMLGMLRDGVSLPPFLSRFKVSQSWAQELQALVLLICFTYMGMAAVMSRQVHGFSFALTSAVGLICFYGYYRHYRLDMAMLALWSLSVMTLIITFIIDFTGVWNSGFTLFWLAIIIIAMTTGEVKWLNTIRRKSNQS